MQSIKITFLSILLVHLLRNFVLPTDRIEKVGNRYCIHLKNGLLHFVLLLTCLSFTYDGVFTWRGQILLAAYVCLCLALDNFKRYLLRRQSISDITLTFVADQLLHVAIMGIIVCLLNNANWKQIIGQFTMPLEVKQKMLGIVAIYAATMFAGGYLIRYLTRSILPDPLKLPESTTDLINAGMYIGWLERFMVLSALIMQSPALVGLILTGKSIARFPELKEKHFAEYFLIGTLLSISIAILGGLALNRMINGTVLLQ